MHYQMSVKLESRRRWVRIRDYIQFKYSINVHFIGNHVNYYSAWRYTTKSDEEYLQSEDHPDLTNSNYPITTNASLAIQRDDVPNPISREKKRKTKCLSVFVVSQLVAKGIRT